MDVFSYFLFVYLLVFPDRDSGCRPECSGTHSIVDHAVLKLKLRDPSIFAS